jgi:hypothetical protein
MTAMTTPDNEAPPVRGAQHEALAVFLGTWRATGTSYGLPERPEDDPKSAASPWISTHTGTWHTGAFFLIQDERANPGDQPFDTLSILGVDAQTGRYVARTFENHGFYRHYAVDGRVWTLTGESERARIEFSADGKTQTIAWEWRPKGRWLPLCDRVAVRAD